MKANMMEVDAERLLVVTALPAHKLRTAKPSPSNVELQTDANKVRWSVDR